MPSTSKPLPSFGALLQETLRTFKKHKKLFLWLGGIQGLLTIALSSLISKEISSITSYLYLKPEDFAHLMASSCLTLCLVPLLMFVAGTIIYIIMTKAALSDRKLDIFDGLRFSLTILLSALWLQILTGLMIWAGLFYLIIPGFYLAIAVVFILQILIDKKANGIDAIIRSKDLVQGNWWYVFGNLFVLGILLMLVNVIFSIFQSMVAFASNDIAVALTYLLTLILVSFSTILTSIFYVKLYKHLVAQKGCDKPKDYDERRRKYMIFTALAYVIPVLFFLSQILIKM